MGVTITLNERLAAQLQSQAAARQMPLEQFAEQILERAIEGCNDDAWVRLNQQRVALINKRMKQPLSPEEKEQLQSLQELADRRLESLDRKRLAEVDEWWRRAEQALGIPGNGEA